MSHISYQLHSSRFYSSFIWERRYGMVLSARRYKCNRIWTHHEPDTEVFLSWVSPFPKKNYRFQIYLNFQIYHPKFQNIPKKIFQGRDILEKKIDTI